MANVRSTETGFVLPVVLVLLAIMTGVIFGIVALTDNARKQTLQQKQQWQAEQEILATESIVKYLLAVHPLDSVGLDPTKIALKQLYQENSPMTGKELLFDGRWYKGVGQAQFSLQDQIGLAPINYTDDETKLLDKLLALQGLKIDERQRLLDALADYIDPDDLKRLNGAEAADYRKAGMSPPANRPLQIPN